MKSDSQLKKDVSEELKWEPSVNATQIGDQIAIKASASAAVVKADIEAALKRRASSDAHDISVSVKGSDVTLKGPVHSWSERELARSAAWGAKGVHKVLDEMTMSY